MLENIAAALMFYLLENVFKLERVDFHNFCFYHCQTRFSNPVHIFSTLVLRPRLPLSRSPSSFVKVSHTPARPDAAEFTSPARKNLNAPKVVQDFKVKSFLEAATFIAIVMMRIVSPPQSHILYPHVTTITLPCAELYFWCLCTFYILFSIYIFLSSSHFLFLSRSPPFSDRSKFAHAICTPQAMFGNAAQELGQG